MKAESKLDLQIKVKSAHANKIKSADKIKFADQTIIPSTICKWRYYFQMEKLFIYRTIIQSEYGIGNFRSKKCCQIVFSRAINLYEKWRNICWSKNIHRWSSTSIAFLSIINRKDKTKIQKNLINTNARLKKFCKTGIDFIDKSSIKEFYFG